MLGYSRFKYTKATESPLNDRYIKNKPDQFNLPKPPELDLDSALGNLLLNNQFTLAERTILALSIAPHIRPDLLEALSIKNQATDQRFAQFGGRHVQQGGFQATLYLKQGIIIT